MACSDCENLSPQDILAGAVGEEAAHAGIAALVAAGYCILKRDMDDATIEVAQELIRDKTAIGLRLYASDIFDAIIKASENAR